MIAGDDQHRVVGEHRLVADVLAHLEHRADGEVDVVGADHRQAVAAGDVVQLELDAGIGLGDTA